MSHSKKRSRIARKAKAYEGARKSRELGRPCPRSCWRSVEAFFKASDGRGALVRCVDCGHWRGVAMRFEVTS